MLVYIPMYVYVPRYLVLFVIIVLLEFDELLRYLPTKIKILSTYLYEYLVFMKVPTYLLLIGRYLPNLNLTFILKDKTTYLTHFLSKIHYFCLIAY